MGKTLGKALVKAAALLLAACLLGGCALEKWISAGQERPKASQGLETAGTLTEILSGLLALPVYIGGSGLSNVINAVITIIISMVVTAIAT